VNARIDVPEFETLARVQLRKCEIWPTYAAKCFLAFVTMRGMSVVVRHDENVRIILTLHRLEGPTLIAILVRY
jgi:hypothetical protein